MKPRFNPKLKVHKSEVNQNPSKVGQAVHDLSQKAPEHLSVEDIISEYGDKYTKEIVSALETNANKYEAPFYIVVLHKKEPWAVNVLRNWFVSRQTRPSASVLLMDYPNHMHTVYSYDKRTSELKLLWSLPTAQDAITIKKNGHLYDPQLLDWIRRYESGELDAQTYQRVA